MTPERGAPQPTPDPAGTRRVFFALWPDDAVRGALAALAGSLHRECGGRLMRGPNIHLTLVFIGNVDAGRLEALERIAGAAAAPPFELVADEIHYWRHNRIAWAGARVIPEALARLVAQLAEPLRAAGFRLDDRPYVPHITLVRDARRAPRDRSMQPLAWPASEFVLVESVRREGRATYEVLRRWPLSA